MRWEAVTFKRDVFLFYGVILIGWPPWLAFGNLSDMAISSIRLLLDLFERGRLYFRKATPGELFAAQDSLHNAVPSLLFTAPVVRNCRSNLNQHWARPTIDPVRFPPRFVRNGPTSARGVDSDDSGSEAISESGDSGSEDSGKASEIEDADEYWGPVVKPVKHFEELEEDPIEQF